MGIIVSGRWGNQIDFSSIDMESLQNKIALQSKSPKALKSKNYQLIATDGEYVVHCRGTDKLSNFYESLDLNPSHPILVLTHKEKRILIETIPEPEYLQKIEVLENIYPIFKDICYRSDAKKNYQSLLKYIGKAKKYSPEGIPLSKYVVAKFHRDLVSKIPFKNGFDQFFAHCNQRGYQEVFKLSEERKSRKIIALDFNSMFPSCLKGTFTDPSSVRYEQYNRKHEVGGKLDQGLYHVILKGVNDSFVRSYHYFPYSLLGKSYAYKLNEGDSIQALLFRNEIEAFAPYFKEVLLIEGCVSSKEIYHPLHNKAQALYKKRQGVKGPSNRNDELNAFYKFCLVHLHSISSPKKQSVISSPNFHNLRSHLNEQFGINTQGIPARSIISALLKLARFDIALEGKQYKLTTPNLSNNQAIYSLSSQVLANARVKMFEFLRQMQSYPSAEVCYVNVDSVHVSVDADKVNDFLVHFSGEISSKLGHLKVQCIADRGYWFDIGRYWLFEGKEVVQYKNAFFNNERDRDQFSRQRFFNTLVHNGSFSYVKKTTKRLESSFSYSKRIEINQGIDNVNFQRYDFSEICDLFKAGDTIDTEILRSKTKKVQTFNRIANRE